MEQTLRFYLLFLLNSMSMATNGTGLNLHCVNDFDREMICDFRLPYGDPNCTEYKLSTEVKESYRPTERNCSFTHGTVRMETCSCSLDIDRFVLGEDYTTTLWKAGDLKESKVISVYNNIKPKAPTLTLVERKNGNYRVEWVTNYQTTISKILQLKVEVTYCRRGEKGMAHNISSENTSYEILEKLLNSSTEYLVNVRSYSSIPSDRSKEMSFTTPMSSSVVVVVVILSLCVAAVISTSSLYLLYARFKEKWWDNVGKYKNSTLLVMVPGEHKVLMPQKTALCSVYVDSRKEHKDDKKPWDSSSWENSYHSARADSVSSSLGYSQKVSMDIISNVEDAMRRALPQISLLPTTAPWLCMAHSNAGYNSVSGTSSLCFFENRTYSIFPPPSGTQGLSAATPPAVLSECFYNPSMLRGALHDPSPDFQVPIFQLTGQWQPLVSRLDSSHMKTDLSYQSWNIDSGSSSPTDDLQVDLSYSSFPSNTTSSSILSDFGSSVSGVCSTGESCPAPACSLVPMDDDYQGFQSVATRPGVLIPEASGERPRDRLDDLSETLFTGMPQKAIDAVRPSMVNTIPTTTPGVQGLLEPQDNKGSADQHKLIIISDYHSV